MSRYGLYLMFCHESFWIWWFLSERYGVNWTQSKKEKVWNLKPASRNERREPNMDTTIQLSFTRDVLARLSLILYVHTYSNDKSTTIGRKDHPNTTQNRFFSIAYILDCVKQIVPILVLDLLRDMENTPRSNEDSCFLIFIFPITAVAL